MRKHAYLIMAHQWSLTLKTLRMMADDVRNDIYIHIDAKSTDFSDNIRDAVHKSGLYFAKRQKVYWADYSQVEVEHQLFCMAGANHYERYHFLSGEDLPIKSQDFIHRFCSEFPDKEFIGTSRHSFPLSKLHRLDVFVPFPHFLRTRFKQNPIGFCIRALDVLLEKKSKGGGVPA